MWRPKEKGYSWNSNTAVTYVIGRLHNTMVRELYVDHIPMMTGGIWYMEPITFIRYIDDTIRFVSRKSDEKLKSSSEIYPIQMGNC